MKKNDIILLCCVLLACGVLFVAMYAAFGRGGRYAVVRVDGEEYLRVSLDDSSEHIIDTQYGKNILTIQDGEAYISDADCPDQTCVHTGKARKNKTVVCLPHHLTLDIEDGE